MHLDCCHASASSSVSPHPTITNSSCMTSVPFSPSTSWFMVRCHTSGAKLMPNVILIQRYRPKGVLKHVSMLDRSSKVIARNHYVHPTQWIIWLYTTGCWLLRWSAWGSTHARSQHGRIQAQPDQAIWLLHHHHARYPILCWIRHRRDDSFVNKLFPFLVNFVAHRDRGASGSMNNWSDGVVYLNWVAVLDPT